MKNLLGAALRDDGSNRSDETRNDGLEERPHAERFFAIHRILGIDEVGRGPWAGPLVIGAVILQDPAAEWCEQLTDSKKLTAKKRQALAAEILEKSAATALGWVSAGELDQIGLAKALKLATRRAVKNILLQKVPFDEIVIDGTSNFLADTPLADKVTILKKADSLIKEVSAASIIAKVARDEYMTELAEIYPQYGFDSHVGYGTAKHRAALAQYGPCPEHRQSFRPIHVLADNIPQPPGQIDNVHNSESEVTSSARNLPDVVNLTAAGEDRCQENMYRSTTSKGHRAESIVAQYLANNGHRILRRNHKTRFYEIDIISIKDDKIYFTEVKYRANTRNGTPLETITPKKQQQMRYAAESFLKYQPALRENFQPLLAAASVSSPNFHLDTWLPLS